MVKDMDIRKCVWNYRNNFRIAGVLKPRLLRWDWTLSNLMARWSINPCSHLENLKKDFTGLDCKTIWAVIRGEGNKIRKLTVAIFLISIFPSSTDTWINSCAPEIDPTKEPSVSGTQAETYTTEMTVRNNIYSALSTDKPESNPLTLTSTTPTSVISSTSTSKKRRVICITEFLMETSTSMISTKTESLVENQTAFKNETNRFGGKSFLCLHWLCVFNR